MRLLVAALVAAALTPVPAAGAAPRTLEVGPGERYRTPCAAFAAARDGDTITIDATGNKDYRGDVCVITADRLTIRGVDGRPHIRAAGANAEGKAIWVVKGDDTTITNVAMSGARVPDQNGAAIRAEGTDLTLQHVYFHDNEMGLLAGDNAESDIRIIRSRFSDNGFGDGYSHNIYVNHVRSLTMKYSWSTWASVGHLVKSRAARTLLFYNRFVSEGSSASYEVDLPNGGLAVLVGNAIQQGKHGENASLVAFGEEGDLIPGSRLAVVGNTMVDDSRGAGNAVLLGEDVSGGVQIRNNVVVDFATLTSGGGRARVAGNCLTTNPRFTHRDRFTYWLRPSSPCLDVTTSTPGQVGGYSLTPVSYYRHKVSGLPRNDGGEIAGAFGKKG